MHNFMPMSPFMPRNNNQDFEPIQCHFKNLLRQNMLAFWRNQMVKIQNASDAKSQHQLPLVRIKKIMKSDEDVKMISADSPILFAKACEIFILELTLRAWLHTEENRRRTLQRCDVAMAIRNEELLDFLTEIVPLESHQEADMMAPSEVIDHQPAFPMNLNNMSPAYFHGEPRNAPIPFVSTIDGVRVPKYDPGFQTRLRIASRLGGDKKNKNLKLV